MTDAAITQIDESLREVITGDETVFEGRLLKVHRLTVTLPNGVQSSREMVRHQGAAAMVVIDEAGNMIFERQWRTPMDRAFWEIPAGKIDPGEDTFTTAQRELMEEVGVTAAKWTYLGTIHNAIGYSNEKIVIYLARDLTAAHQDLDENEFLSLHRIPLEKVEEMAANGEITDVKTLAGIMWYRMYLSGGLTQAKEMTL